MVHYPDQGTPVDDLNIDQLMQMKMAELKQYLEPYAAEHFGAGEMALVSLAISAKRVADNQHHSDNLFSQLLTGINSLCTVIKDMDNHNITNAGSLATAIRNVEYELRASDARSISINVSKD